MGKKRSEIPYGPHLAIATVIVVLCRPVVDWTLEIVMPTTQIQSVQILQNNRAEVELTYVVGISEQNIGYFDLTNRCKVGSIRKKSVSRWMRQSETDVRFIKIGRSSDMEKGHA
jgi:hypothetical protein